MISQFLETIFSRRIYFLLVFGAVTLVLAGSSFWVISFVRNETVEQSTAMEVEDTGELSLIYVDYYSNIPEYVSAEAYLTMGEYIRENEETQNVEVLVGLSPSEIVGYMLNHFVAGMQVNCDYCHNINNYAADEWDDEEAMENKRIAREHLLMTQDLNRNWLTELPALTDEKQPSGAQIACATCHFGQAQPVTWPTGEIALPDDFRLPLDEPLSATEQDILNVNAREDISLDAVQYNQQVMYYMNASMNVGCTHCHNSRYFPSWEVPAKYYAQHMLQMTQYIHQEWGDSLGEQEPSCLMCHQGAAIPPGAAQSVDVMPAALVPEQ
ncbi:MAG: photosynthetic reaction center cytochrome c subunit family protein [Anaerolineae bacterium]